MTVTVTATATVTSKRPTLFTDRSLQDLRSAVDLRSCASKFISHNIDTLTVTVTVHVSLPCTFEIAFFCCLIKIVLGAGETFPSHRSYVLINYQNHKRRASFSGYSHGHAGCCTVIIAAICH